MYAHAKQEDKPSASFSTSTDETRNDDKALIAKQARRILLPGYIQTHQQAFHYIYQVHGLESYNELWSALSDKIPLNSTQLITPQHMEAIADFIVTRELISRKIYTRTTPSDIPIDVAEIRRYLQKIPVNVLEKAFSFGQVLTATNDNITNHPRMNKYKHFTPRGWPAGTTLESLSGMGAPGKVAMEGTHPDETIIALSKNSAGGWSLAGGHSATNLVLHEYGHAIDRSFGEKGLMGPKGTGEAGDFLSRRESFIAAWKRDLSNTPPDSHDNYYWQGGSSGGAEEAFAEGFSDLYLQSNARNWPNIKSYIENKMKSIK